MEKFELYLFSFRCFFLLETRREITWKGWFESYKCQENFLLECHHYHWYLYCRGCLVSFQLNKLKLKVGESSQFIMCFYWTVIKKQLISESCFWGNFWSVKFWADLMSKTLLLVSFILFFFSWLFFCCTVFLLL